MRRTSLENLPALSIPTPYQLRVAGPEEADTLARLLSEAYEDPNWAREKIFSEFLDNPSVPTTFAIMHGGTAYACASAKRHPDFDGVGYVHYVAALPKAPVRGLGFQVTLAVLHEFARWGCPGAVLHTDDFRLPAIVTYLRLGFQPDLWHESHPDRWTTIQNILGKAYPETSP
jgi:mycothiol synthase